MASDLRSAAVDVCAVGAAAAGLAWAKAGAAAASRPTSETHDETMSFCMAIFLDESAVANANPVSNFAGAARGHLDVEAERARVDFDERLAVLQHLPISADGLVQLERNLRIFVVA